MIDFNIAPHTGNEVKYIQEAIASGKILRRWNIYQKMQSVDERTFLYQSGISHHFLHSCT